MKGAALTVLLAIFLAGVAAKPVSDQDCNRKGKYYQVNCAEQLQFVHPKATCYMNDNGDFFIMTLDKSKDMSSTDAVQDLWTESPLIGNEAPSDPDDIAPVKGSDDVVENWSDTQKQTEVEGEAKAKEDNSGALLLGLLAIAVLAGG